ncbi:COPII subunit, partial [Blyttiomyces sp. JEL0837]
MSQQPPPPSNQQPPYPGGPSPRPGMMMGQGDAGMRPPQMPGQPQQQPFGMRPPMAGPMPGSGSAGSPASFSNNPSPQQPRPPFGQQPGPMMAGARPPVIPGNAGPMGFGAPRPQQPQPMQPLPNQQRPSPQPQPQPLLSRGGSSSGEAPSGGMPLNAGQRIGLGRPQFMPPQPGMNPGSQSPTSNMPPGPSPMSQTPPPNAAAGPRSKRVYANMDATAPAPSAGPAIPGSVVRPPGAPLGPPSFVTPAAPPSFGMQPQAQQQPPMMSGGPMMGGPQNMQQPPNMQQPQMGQPGPQFLQPAQPPQFGGGPPGMPAGGMQQMQQQPQMQPGYMNQLNQGMQNMSVQGNQRGPVSVNLLQRHMNVNELEGPEPPAWLSPQFSVSQAPTAVCPPSYKRCTINAIPQNPANLAKSKVPFGLIVTPYRHLLPGEEPVPVINPPQIVRCRRCRTYINPWVQFVEQGTRWKCNMCFLTNEVPSFFDWDAETRAHVDRMKRPELTHSVVEYIAPQEYMVRPPQPVVIIFVIDVSYPAVQSGMVAVAARTILESLDKIPNTDNRTKVGFITVDSALHFYNLSSSISEPQMLVVSDLDDVFVPLPYDLLVPLTESRPVIEKLLAGMATMFQNNTSTQNVLGRALLAAHKLIASIGGKIVVLQNSLPTGGDGALKAREDPKVLGTPKEVILLQPQNGFYKSFAVDSSRSQISLDMFLFAAQYADVATLSGCAKYTGGSVYYYPSFSAGRQEDVQKFSTEFSHFLSRPIGLEAVLRVRASKGIKMVSFHGNFFLRSTDLLALPNVSPDNSYAVEMILQDNITSSAACFQTALLHTSSNGERRIRVITLALPVTNNYSDIFASADQIAIAALFAKKSVEKSLSNNIEFARDEAMAKLTDILSAYKASFTSSGQSSQLVLPENLKMLPLLTLGLLKNTSIRTNAIVPSDLRSYALALMYVFPPELCITNIHPRFWALHTMEPAMGLPGEDGRILFPPLLNLSSEKLERNGFYLLENGQDIYIWIGRAISPEFIQMVFDRPSYDAVATGKVTLPTLNNVWSQRVGNLIAKIRELRLLMMTTSPHVFVVKEDGDAALRMWFLSHLIEDRTDSSHSYPQFLALLRDK